MCGLITEGYGPNSRIILKGYGGFWRKVVEAITRLVVRLVPVRRRHFATSIRVYGDLEVPFSQTIEVYGTKDFMKLWELVIEDD